MGILNCKCDRCGKETKSFKMSFFNEEECCKDCILIESMHDEYERARKIETDECRSGNYNYKGIGLPVNYEDWSSLFKNKFNFEIYSESSYYGKPSEEKYFLRDKDCRFQLCLNNYNMQSCDNNKNKIASKEINSLEELRGFINSVGLNYNKDVIKDFFYDNMKRKETKEQ